MNLSGIEYYLFPEDKICLFLAGKKIYTKVFSLTAKKCSRKYIKFYENLGYITLECLIFNEYYDLLEKWHPVKNILIYAAKHGKLEFIKNSDKPEGKFWLIVTAVAAENGHIEIVKYLYENGFPCDYIVYVSAASKGHLKIIKYLHENGCDWDENSADYKEAAKYLSFLRNTRETDVDYFYSVAVKNCCLEVVKYLHQDINYPWDPEVFMYAAEFSNLEIVKYLHQNDCPWNYKVLDNAAGNSLEIVKYLHENGYPWSHRAYFKAVSKGDLEIVKYLHQNNCPKSEYIYNHVKNNDLEIVKYLHQNGFPWGVHSYADAADSGYLEIVKYLHQNGCPWDIKILDYAVEAGYSEIIKYFTKQ